MAADFRALRAYFAPLSGQALATAGPPLIPTMHANPQEPQNTVATLFIPYVFGLVVFFFGFTDLPRRHEESFLLFCVFLALLAVPIVANARRKRRHSTDSRGP